MILIVKKLLLVVLLINLSCIWKLFTPAEYHCIGIKDYPPIHIDSLIGGWSIVNDSTRVFESKSIRYYWIFDRNGYYYRYCNDPKERDETEEEYGRFSKQAYSLGDSLAIAFQILKGFRTKYNYVENDLDTQFIDSAELHYSMKFAVDAKGGLDELIYYHNGNPDACADLLPKHSFTRIQTDSILDDIWINISRPE